MASVETQILVPRNEKVGHVEKSTGVRFSGGYTLQLWPGYTVSSGF